MKRHARGHNRLMLLLLLEALGALLVLVLIVWWTMFSGRNAGELRDQSGSAKNAGAKPDDDLH